MKFLINQSDIRFYLSEFQLDESTSFSDLSSYLELILNGPFSVWEENGELILLQIKARVDTYRGLEIHINPNEHPPPHFHVHSGNVNASFKIEDCFLIGGKISDSDFRKVRYWHSKSKHKLIKMWNSTRPTKCIVGKYQEDEN